MTRNIDSGDGGAMPEPKHTPNKSQQSRSAKGGKVTALSAEDLRPQELIPGVGHNSDMTRKALLVSTHLSHRKEEGAHYVKRCQVVVEAEDELPSDIFKEFCKEVDLPRNSSMFRKARTIAKVATKLLAVADRLPDSRSAIYELAKVDPNVFHELVDSKERITAARVKAALPTAVKPERCVVSVDITGLRDGERAILLQAVKEAADQAGAKVKFSKSLQIGEMRP